jgi:hypothetical protein
MADCIDCEAEKRGGACPRCGMWKAQPAPATAMSRPTPRGFLASAWESLVDFLGAAWRMLREGQLVQEFGKLNPALICPHCQMKGAVRAKPINRKAGISGGKVAAAVLLSPLTLLATGVSRTERATQAHCDNCKSTWTF